MTKDEIRDQINYWKNDALEKLAELRRLEPLGTAEEISKMTARSVYIDRVGTLNDILDLLDQFEEN